MTFLHLGKTIVNTDHVVSIKKLKPEAARTYYDPDARADLTIQAKPVRVELTLTALEVHTVDISESTSIAASQSQTITVSGDLAEYVWEHFMRMAATFGQVRA